MKARRAILCLVLLVGAVIALGRSLVIRATRPAPIAAAPPAPPAPSEQSAPPESKGSEQPRPPPAVEVPWSVDPSVFSEWLALGSGCRARSTEPGDVTMERLAFRRGDVVVQRARFHLAGLRLTDADRPADRRLSFAKECSLRVQVGPPPGQRLVDVTARTRVISTKSEGLKLTLAAALRLGAARIALQLVGYDAAELHQDREESMMLSRSAHADEPFPSLGCAEPKLIGFDYTWIAEPTGSGGDVSVEVAGHARVLDVDAALAACP